LTILPAAVSQAVSDAHYPHLLAKGLLAGKPLKNRIVHASITLRYGGDEVALQRMINYHAARARGGAAMIVTEPLGIAPHQGNQRVAAYDNSMVDGLRRLADAVESQDCRLLGQVQDTGRGRHVPGRTFNAIGPSALPDDISWTVPHAMSQAEIASFIESAASACLRLKCSGFSGVEVSAGHGHMFHQFLSPRSNHREDMYGGDLAGRCRLLIELCLAIRAACGADFILGVKLPGDDGVPGSVDPAAAESIARYLTRQVDVDYLAYAQGSHHRTLEMHLPDGSYPRSPYLDMTRQLKLATPDVPVMALGRITDPAEAERIVADGMDFVALGRALIADPTWPLKSAEGRAADIRYCVSCNTCWKVINSQSPIACDNNPLLAAASELGAPAPATSKRHITVVGAGISGLEAALTAARRGHDVTVFGASVEPGGKARLYAAMPIAESVSSIYDYQFAEAQRLGVTFKLGRVANVQDIVDTAPDAVVLAAGSTMSWPLALPTDLRAEGVVQDLRTAIASLSGITRPQPGTAVIFDMDHTDGTYAAVERLRDLFARVVILTPRDRIAEDTALVVRQRVLRRFHERSIDVITLVEPRWTSAMEERGALQYESVFGGSLRTIEDVSFFSYATPRVPNVRLQGALRAAGLNVHPIGDCKVARGTLDATAEGYAIGLSL
jgi:2,4-dienoyl-CoA reductase-like NADH-dependent reductase (Old Yellow Enzyme family)